MSTAEEGFQKVLRAFVGCSGVSARPVRSSSSNGACNEGRNEGRMELLTPGFGARNMRHFSVELRVQ